MILLGTASLATAQPKQEETSGRVSLKEKAPDNPREDAPRSPSDWVELASATPAKHGTQYIIVGREAGGFGKLRIDAVKGGIPIKQVRVSFTDGSSKTYRLNKRVDANHQKSVFVDLPTTQEIDQVVIVTDRRSKGEYALYGSGTGGVVAGR
jgi:hypothetical protein